MNKKQLTTKINELHKKLNPLQKELKKIEGKESLKEKQKLLGKCFKFQNSSSSDKKWWIYAKVIAVSEHVYTHLIVERNPDGNLKIDLVDNFTYHADYYLHEIEIQEWEFQEQLKTMIRDFSFHIKEEE